MRFFFFCLALVFSLGGVRAQDLPADPWKTEIDSMLARDASDPPPQHGVLFIGSSSIRMWSTLARDFPGVPVLNRGFGGSRIADSTRNAGRLVVPYHPALVVLYAGDNDIAEKRRPAQVVEDFRVFVARVRRDSPHLPVVFISIKPSIARAALWSQMREANDGIRQWARTQSNVIYVDVASKMLDANGRPRPELLLADGLHMQPAGYAIWVAALNPVLARYGFGSRRQR